MSFHRKYRKKVFLVAAIYQAENLTLALPLHEKNVKKP